MKILKIWFSEYPWDVRVEKIINALLTDNHEVHLLCRNNRGEKRNDKNKFNIHRLPYIKKGKNRLNKIINFPAFFNPIWFFEIMRCIKKYQIELIIVRDLPLTLPALLAGNLFDIKVIFDMAECHPEIFKNYFKWNFKSIFKENPWVAKFVEKITIKYMDHIFVMCEESKSRLISIGIDDLKVSVVSNTTRIHPNINQKNTSDELRFIYVGMIGEFRGLDIVIDVMPILLSKYNLNIFFDILGNVGDYLDKLKEKVRRLNLEQRVVFHGWVKNNEIDKYIEKADIGVLPLWKLSHYDVTVSNKLFDYMACSIPVVSSNVTSMARIIRESKCGLIFEDRDLNQFIQCVLDLTNTKLRQELGENGKRAVEEKYNWESDRRRMLNIINSIKDSKGVYNQISR
jgi:glycosyltransferase involved in cell wall biosynthesis